MLVLLLQSALRLYLQIQVTIYPVSKELEWKVTRNWENWGVDCEPTGSILCSSQPFTLGVSLDSNDVHGVSLLQTKVSLAASTICGCLSFLKDLQGTNQLTHNHACTWIQMCTWQITWFWWLRCDSLIDSTWDVHSLWIFSGPLVPSSRVPSAPSSQPPDVFSPLCPLSLSSSLAFVPLLPFNTKSTKHLKTKVLIDGWINRFKIQFYWVRKVK